MEKHIAPYGSWKSPITSDLIVQGTVGLRQIACSGEHVYWIEGRPLEGGRSVLVRRSADGTVADVTPAPFNARTRVHEYGGGEYLVHGETLYFSHFADQRLYRQQFGQAPEPITPASAMRFADAVMDPHRNRIVCVREDHSVSDQEAVNTIVAIDLANENEGQVLVSGCNFYAFPRLSPKGTKLAWICWNHPNMPWDGTELRVADINPDGSLGESQLVAGGVTESIFQPEWSPDGTLHFISDRSGWWNHYAWREETVTSLCPLDAEFGEPMWVFGMSTYGFVSADECVCTWKAVTGHLGTLNLKTGELKEINLPFTSFSDVRVLGRSVVCLAGSPTVMAAIIRVNLDSGEYEVLRRSSDLEVDPAFIAVPEAIEYPTENGLTAYAFLYLPKNNDFTALEGEKPPLLVKSHGGPTGATTTVLRLAIQYWTSRGFAVLDVDYGGSTGYGRAYRERLREQWGVVDVDDCANGARYLVEKGLVDRNRLTIDGGSAGGYTTLATLTFRDVFKAGASHYGVSDIEALVHDTHKFESRYGDFLIGPYPERRDVYLARSPIHHTDGLNCPVIFFQGLEDKVVPPNQAEMMVAALRAKGVPVAYVPFEGEQHGFRKAENVKRALDGEFYFYSQVFGFTPAETIESVEIENL
ncbi:MAG: S9 family peptidase [Blastocatellia bacterium]|nr:S9 family peptidase [Blastocatellia bacterium]